MHQGLGQPIHRHGHSWTITGVIVTATVAFTFIGSVAVINVGAKTTGKTGSGLEDCVPAQNMEAIIDDSGSMRSSDWHRLRLAALELLINKPGNEGKTLGAVEFGRSATSIFGPALIDGDKLTLLNKLDESILGDNGTTNYNDAFRLAVKENGKAKAMIFLTDGRHNHGKYKNLHRQAPKTYVIGFSGSEGTGRQVRHIRTQVITDQDRDRLRHRRMEFTTSTRKQNYGGPLLERIAAETRGDYYGDVTTDNIQAVFNEIDSKLNCESKPEQIEDTFDESDKSASRAKHHRLAIKKGASSANLVVTWPDSTKSMKVSSMRIVRRGKVVASPKPLKSSVKKLGITKAKGMTYQAINIKNLAPGTLQYTLTLKKVKRDRVRNPYVSSGKSKSGLVGAVPFSVTSAPKPSMKALRGKSGGKTNVTTQLSQR